MSTPFETFDELLAARQWGTNRFRDEPFFEPEFGLANFAAPEAERPSLSPTI